MYYHIGRVAIFFICILWIYLCQFLVADGMGIIYIKKSGFVSQFFGWQIVDHDVVLQSTLGSHSTARLEQRMQGGQFRSAEIARRMVVYSVPLVLELEDGNQMDKPRLLVVRAGNKVVQPSNRSEVQ